MQSATLEIGRMRRQPGQGDVRRNCELAALMIARPIHDQQDMPPGKLLGQGVQEYLEAFRIR
jgi:hypothetical protein